MYKNKEYVLGGPQVRVCGKLIVDNDLELATAAKNISAENTVSGSLLVSGETEFQKCQVSEDLVVQGSATVGENLTVLGNLNAGLGLPVHVVQDSQGGRIMPPNQDYDPRWFTSLIKTKQDLIDLSDVSGFKLLESGTYLIYLRYSAVGDGLAGTVHRTYKNGSELTYYWDHTIHNDITHERIFFIQTNNANETIRFRLSYISGRSTVQHAHKAQFGVVKLA
jgi:hypothetical protein